MPPNLQALVDTGFLPEPDVLRCPASAKEPPVNPKRVDATGSYFYAPLSRPDSVATPADVPIAWDKKDLHRGVNVLFADGTVALMSSKELAAAVAANSCVYATPPQMPQPAP
jgi:prepilin-type processing-associated H-X9-DG protein